MLIALDSGHPDRWLPVGMVLELGASVYATETAAGHLWLFPERVDARGMR